MLLFDESIWILDSESLNPDLKLRLTPKPSRSSAFECTSSGEVETILLKLSSSTPSAAPKRILPATCSASCGLFVPIPTAPAPSVATIVITSVLFTDWKLKCLPLFKERKFNSALASARPCSNTQGLCVPSVKRWAFSTGLCMYRPFPAPLRVLSVMSIRVLPIPTVPPIVSTKSLLPPTATFESNLVKGAGVT